MARPRKRGKEKKKNSRNLQIGIIIVIVFLVILIAIGIFQKNSNKNSSLNKCIQSFNQCKDKNADQNGISLVLLDKGRFTSETKAKEFFEKWKSSLLQENFQDEVKSAVYPIVLLANSIQKGEVKINFVIVCESSGEIVEWMKKQLSC